jgi:hypothetical protein
MPPKSLPVATVETISKWRNYRDPRVEDFTEKQARDYYRRRPFNVNDTVLPVLPPSFITPFVGPPKPATLPDAGDITPERQEFFDRRIPELQTFAAAADENKWMAEKFLGRAAMAWLVYGNMGQLIDM